LAETKPLRNKHVDALADNAGALPDNAGALSDNAGALADNVGALLDALTLRERVVGTTAGRHWT